MNTTSMELYKRAFLDNDKENLNIYPVENMTLSLLFKERIPMDKQNKIQPNYFLFCT